MKTVSKTIEFKTKGFTDIINITDILEEKLKDSKLKGGIMTVMCPGSTGAITTCEYESGLIRDLKDFFEKLIPSNKKYAHDAQWQDGNGFSHLRASVIGPSLSVPFKVKKLILGTWQQIVFIDFDNRSRSRKLHIQFIGNE